jgi:hypothetical protein
LEIPSQPIARCGDIHLSIPATWKAEIGRIIVPGQLGQKKFETPSLEKSWTWWLIPVIPVMERSTK